MAICARVDFFLKIHSNEWTFFRHSKLQKFPCAEPRIANGFPLKYHLIRCSFVQPPTTEKCKSVSFCERNPSYERMRNMRKPRCPVITSICSTSASCGQRQKRRERTAPNTRTHVYSFTLRHDASPSNIHDGINIHSLADGRTSFASRQTIVVLNEITWNYQGIICTEFIADVRRESFVVMASVLCRSYTFTIFPIEFQQEKHMLHEHKHRDTLTQWPCH